MLASQDVPPDSAQISPPHGDPSSAPVYHGGYPPQQSVSSHSSSSGNVCAHGSGANSTASAHTSTEINSHNNTIFSHAPLSDRSHTHSLSFMESSSQPGATGCNNVQFTSWSYLQSDPMLLSQELLEAALSENRYHMVWCNWEKSIVMHFWLGQHASDEHCLLAMSAPRTPRPDDPVSAEWHQVRNSICNYCLLTLPLYSSLPTGSIRSATQSHLCETGGLWSICLPSLSHLFPPLSLIWPPQFLFSSRTSLLAMPVLPLG
jgi:hypothetical protein